MATKTKQYCAQGGMATRHFAAGGFVDPTSHASPEQMQATAARSAASGAATDFQPSESSLPGDANNDGNLSGSEQYLRDNGGDTGNKVMVSSNWLNKLSATPVPQSPYFGGQNLNDAAAGQPITNGRSAARQRADSLSSAFLTGGAPANRQMAHTSADLPGFRTAGLAPTPLPDNAWDDTLGYAKGGPVFPRKTGAIHGKGTATSDSIPAMLSDGEFVIPANVVEYYGADMFRNMIATVTGHDATPKTKAGAVHANGGGIIDQPGTGMVPVGGGITPRAKEPVSATSGFFNEPASTDPNFTLVDNEPDSIRRGNRLAATAQDAQPVSQTKFGDTMASGNAGNPASLAAKMKSGYTPKTFATESGGISGKEFSAGLRSLAGKVTNPVAGLALVNSAVSTMAEPSEMDRSLAIKAANGDKRAQEITDAGGIYGAEKIKYPVRAITNAVGDALNPLTYAGMAGDAIGGYAHDKINPNNLSNTLKQPDLINPNNLSNTTLKHPDLTPTLQLKDFQKKAAGQASSYVPDLSTANPTYRVDKHVNINSDTGNNENITTFDDNKGNHNSIQFADNRTLSPSRMDTLAATLNRDADPAVQERLKFQASLVNGRIAEQKAHEAQDVADAQNNRLFAIMNAPADNSSLQAMVDQGKARKNAMLMLALAADRDKGNMQDRQHKDTLTQNQGQFEVSQAAATAHALAEQRQKGVENTLAQKKIDQDMFAPYPIYQYGIPVGTGLFNKKTGKRDDGGVEMVSDWEKLNQAIKKDPSRKADFLDAYHSKHGIVENADG